jgi:hypothetical protein
MHVIEMEGELRPAGDAMPQTAHGRREAFSDASNWRLLAFAGLSDA